MTAVKKKRKVVQAVLLGAAALLVLVVVLYGAVGAAESGVFGARLQTWTRIEKPRFNFNRVYSMASPPFEQTASAFLVRCVEGVRPGTALDIAAGQGRNAVYLAKSGWRVTAFDISDAGMMARIRESVAPGGIVVVDNPALMHRPSGAGPRVPGDLEPGELPKLFPGFDIIDYTEGEATSDWFHLKTSVGRLLAKKKS